MKILNLNVILNKYLIITELEPVTADRTETLEFSTESPGLQEQLQAQTCKKMIIDSPVSKKCKQYILALPSFAVIYF